MENKTVISGMPWQTFVSVDWWHNFSNTANVTFNGRKVVASLSTNSLEVRGGASVNITNISAFGAIAIEYTTNMGGETRRSIGGNAGSASIGSYMKGLMALPWFQTARRSCSQRSDGQLL